jgi:hypothetical protein
LSFTAFKEVSTANPGTSTRYGSDDLLDIMKIFNAKITGNRRPDILNPWRFSTAVELKQVSSPTAPTDANVIILYNDAADNKLKVKKSGGGVINLEDLGSGAWSNSGAETITNKTIPIESNFIKHGTTNFVGDLLKYDGTRYNRIAKGAANQVLAVNASATDLEWQTPAGGGGGGGEANTASNVGSAGIGWFLQKIGVDLQFKKVFSPTGSILVTDNVANDRIDLDLGASVVKNNQANVYGDFQQEFRSSRLIIKNPANTFGYFLVGGAITVSRNVSFPVLGADDTFAMLTAAQIMLNKTLSSGNIMDVDTNTLKHSTTNAAGELLRNTGTKYDRLAKGAAGTYLRVNSGGTDLEYGTLPSATGGVRLPGDNSIASTTGRWGAFFGGAANGMNMLAMTYYYDRLHGSTIDSLESVTEIYTAAVANDFAEFKTAAGFRRDSSAVFKIKWRATSSSDTKIKIGLNSTTSMPRGSGGGSATTIYNVPAGSGQHLEYIGSTSRAGIRFASGASGIGQAVTQVIVKFRQIGNPSGTASVGVRKNSDGTFVSLGSFSPGSFGSGEQSVTINATSNSYIMQTNDRVSVEYPPNSSNSIELTQDPGSSNPSGYPSEEYDGSWAASSDTISMTIQVSTTGGAGSGDAPLDGNNGLMVYASQNLATNYKVARNNASSVATVVDSGKAANNTSTHTAEFNINNTNMTLVLDGTTFGPYTTFVPSTSTPMAFWFHIENASSNSKGLGIAYAQVVLS